MLHQRKINIDYFKQIKILKNNNFKLVKKDIGLNKSINKILNKLVFKIKKHWHIHFLSIKKKWQIKSL